MLRVIRVGKDCLILAIPFAAVAGDLHVKTLDPELVPLATWVWVLGLSLMGWLASRGHELAGWTDQSTGIAKLLQSVVASLLAGVGAYLGGLYIDAPKSAAFLATIGASYGGSEYLSKMRKS